MTETETQDTMPDAEAPEGTLGNATATYDPSDNKLRLYAVGRLPQDVYERVRAAGFKWAPKQELFVAPMWTPEREDLLLELCGNIGDEDTGLVDRAAWRAERFEEYRDKRTADANAAKAAVDQLSSAIPMGQPILVGHHSEKRARKDAERIQNGMRRAVQMWETASYWRMRAVGAVRNAAYKERPDVRHRRIKGLEADLRKQEKTRDNAKRWMDRWGQAGLTHEQVVQLANYDSVRRWRKTADGQIQSESLYQLLSSGEITDEDAQKHAVASHLAALRRVDRWITHFTNRLEYERAMLADALGGGDGDGPKTMAERFDVQVGGRVQVGTRRAGVAEWLVVLRVNKTGGQVTSVTTSAPHAVTWRKDWKYGIEEVTDYRPPTEDETAKVKAATKLPPLCNYPGEGFLHLTTAEYEQRKPKWSDFPKISVVAATEQRGAHRVRQVPGAKMWERQLVFLTDAKRVDPPAPRETPLPAPEVTREALDRMVEANKAREARQEADAPFTALKEQLRSGQVPTVQVVHATGFFVTPAAVAAQMVAALDVRDGHRVLEPSAGTGALIDAVLAVAPGADITAVEQHADLAMRLQDRGLSRVACADFLTWVSAPKYDRIIMNPPFDRGLDIEHIRCALALLAPGGRLVALCAAGPRQREAFAALPFARWTDLPPNSFKEAGTGVNVAMVVVDVGTVTVGKGSPPPASRKVSVDMEE